MLREYIEKVNTSGYAFFCIRCLELADPFHIRTCVWDKAFPDYFEMRKDIRKRTSVKGAGVLCCLPCLEKILDRQLRLEDFTDAPINNAIRFAWARGGGVSLPWVTA